MEVETSTGLELLYRSLFAFRITRSTTNRAELRTASLTYFKMRAGMSLPEHWTHCGRALLQDLKK
jgi:hypothetical protein